MREPTTEWMEMTLRVERFLKTRLPDEQEYWAVERGLGKLLLEEQVLREDYARILQNENWAHQVRARGRQAVEAPLKALAAGTVELQESDSPQRVLKVCRRVLEEGEEAGKPADLLNELQRLIWLLEATQAALLESAPAQRLVETALQRKWRELYEYLELLDEVVPPVLADLGGPELFAEWKQIRKVVPPGQEPRRAA